MFVRPGGGVAGDDSDVGLLRLGGGERRSAQGGLALLASQILTGYHGLAVLHFLCLLVIIDHSNVFGHVFKLVGQPLTFNFGKDATLVVIPIQKQQMEYKLSRTSG